MTTDEIKAAAAELEGEAPTRILRWVADQFPGRVTFATSLGIEDCVLTDMIGRAKLPIELFTLDTGLLFQESYALWADLEEKYDLQIKRVSPDHSVDEQARLAGPELWLRDPDRCCNLRKIQPLENMLSKYEAWITAIRRDQTPERANSPVVSFDARFGLVKVNPLVRWTSEDVRTYVREHNVPYNPLHDQNYPSIGCVPCTSQVRPGEDPRSGRWRGNDKTECGLHWVKSAGDQTA